MFPHERSLVTKYQDRPFVLLGVNLDPSMAILQQAQERYHLNWRSWWDGREGSIAAAWKAPYLPTLFLLDHKGLVRWRHEGVPDSGHLDELIEQLVREAEADTKKQVALNKR